MSADNLRILADQISSLRKLFTLLQIAIETEEEENIECAISMVPEVIDRLDEMEETFAELVDDENYKLMSMKCRKRRDD